jgi:long-subunit acyl-CoA synthetase (AMP-forming)
MSETCGGGAVNPPDRIKIGTVGPPTPGCELKLAEDGELLIRGGLVMLGYRGLPDKTAEAIDPDGWLHTGDIATIDGDGYVRIVDRKKELIITSGGKNVSPANLESLLKGTPLVGQTAVIGDRRPYLVALIVLDADALRAWASAHGRAGAPVSELAECAEVLAEIQRGVDAVNEQVSQAERIRRWRILPTEWTAESGELTPTLKLKRRVIAERYAREIEDLYSQARIT